MKFIPSNLETLLASYSIVWKNAVAMGRWEECPHIILNIIPNSSHFHINRERFFSAVCMSGKLSGTGDLFLDFAFDEKDIQNTASRLEYNSISWCLYMDCKQQTQ